MPVILMPAGHVSVTMPFSGAEPHAVLVTDELSELYVPARQDVQWAAALAPAPAVNEPSAQAVQTLLWVAPTIVL